MADLKDLYQDIILDHYRNPRNRRKPQHSNKQADRFNPLCGDKFEIYLQIENGIISDICFDGAGCAISLASASMMTEILKGKSEAEAKTIHDQFLHLLTDDYAPILETESLKTLLAFSSVRQYPVRVQCATLAWQALRAAIDQNQLPVSTE